MKAGEKIEMTALAELDHLTFDNNQWRLVILSQTTYSSCILPSSYSPGSMASNTVAAARQPSLPPSIPSRHASVDPTPRTLANIARARSVSVEPETLTPRATSLAPQSSGETRAESVEPTSSSSSQVN